MTPKHPRDVLDMIARLAERMRTLEGQQSSSTPRRGTATLAAGAVTVPFPSVTAASQIHVGTLTPGGTVGAPFVFSKTAGTGFVIHSTSGTDTSVVAYAIY